MHSDTSWDTQRHPRRPPAASAFNAVHRPTIADHFRLDTAQRSAETTTTPTPFLLFYSYQSLCRPRCHCRYLSRRIRFYRRFASSQDGRFRGQRCRRDSRWRSSCSLSSSLGICCGSSSAGSGASGWILRSRRSQRCKRSPEPSSRQLRQGACCSPFLVPAKALLTLPFTDATDLCQLCDSGAISLPPLPVPILL